MKKTSALLAVVGLTLTAFAQNAMDAYHGDLPIDSTVVTLGDTMVVEQVNYQYDAKDNVIGMQHLVLNEDSSALKIDQDEKVSGDTLVIFRDLTYKEALGKEIYVTRDKYLMDANDSVIFFQTASWSEDPQGYIVSSEVHYSYPTPNKQVAISYYGYGLDSLILNGKIETEVRGDSTFTISSHFDSIVGADTIWVAVMMEVRIQHRTDSIEWFEGKVVMDSLGQVIGWAYDFRTRIVTCGAHKTEYVDQKDEETGEWKLYYRTESDNDRAGRILLEITMEYENSAWVNRYKMEYEYATDGSYTSTRYTWNTQTSQWDRDDEYYGSPRRKITTSFSDDQLYKLDATTDDNGTIIRVDAFLFNPATKDWDIFAYQHKYTYYHNGKDVTPEESPTSIDETLESVFEQSVQKVIRNGQLYILYNGEVYNAKGQRVK